MLITKTKYWIVLGTGDTVSGENSSLNYLFWKDQYNLKGLVINKHCRMYSSLSMHLLIPKEAAGQDNQFQQKANELTSVTNKKKTPFLQIHGNFLYDMNYRSQIDTPFMERDIYQHSFQTQLAITVKDKYPINVNFTGRFGNSQFFQDFSNVHFQFNPQQFSNQIKQKVQAYISKVQIPNAELLQLDALIDENKNQYQQLRNWLNNPATLQQLIEEKERQLMATAKDTLANIPQIKEVSSNLNTTFQEENNYLFKKVKFQKGSKIPQLKEAFKAFGDNKTMQDSFKTAYQFKEIYEKKQKQLDSIKQLLQVLMLKSANSKAALNNAKQITNTSLEKLNTVKDFNEKVSEWQLPDSVLPKGYKTLLALKSFNIGRTNIDYSDLTARNISITGIEISYQPGNYYAFASGYIDYRFRDLVIQQNSPRQYLNILRFGKGLQEGNHIIATYFFGSRQLFHSNTAGSNSQIPNYQLVGYSVEARYQLTKNTFFTAELAKSSQPYYNREHTKPNLIAESIQFTERSNEAYAFKISSLITQTATQISGSFRKIGSNFQSFSVFTTGAAQKNWMIKVDQPFFKRRLKITASLRTNDLVNPYIGNNFQSSAIFKSLYASLRLKNWPVITAGYYPSSQLTKLGEGRFTEYLFYNLIGTLNHQYHIGGRKMLSTVVVSKFYNKPTDSAFMYFNTTNLMLSQQLFFSQIQWQFNFNYSRNNDFRMYVTEANIQYKIKNWLFVGGGVKYNIQPSHNQRANNVWGYNTNATFTIQRIGEIQLLVDKGFIPGNNQQLVPNNIGRLSYFKTF